MEYLSLYETMDNSFEIEWRQQLPDYWYGTFDVDGTKYSVTISEEDGYYSSDGDEEKWFEISFGLSEDGFSGTKVVGTNNNQFKIFATVIKGFTEALTQLKPTNIIFSAYKGNRNRIALYDRLLRKFSEIVSMLGYTQTSNPSNKYLPKNYNMDDEYKSYAYTRK